MSFLSDNGIIIETLRSSETSGIVASQARLLQLGHGIKRTVKQLPARWFRSEGRVRVSR